MPDQKFRDENRGGTKTHVASHYSFCVSYVETNTFFAWKFARLWAVMFIEFKLPPNFTFPHRGPYWAFVSPLWCILVTDYYKFRSKTSVINIIIIMITIIVIIIIIIIIIIIFFMIASQIIRVPLLINFSARNHQHNPLRPLLKSGKNSLFKLRLLLIVVKWRINQCSLLCYVSIWGYLFVRAFVPQCSFTVLV